jgi:type IV pilus assembly protein PilB
MGIFEMMILTDEIRDLVMRRASTNLIRQEAVRQGMRSLREGGLRAIYDGLTTIEEVAKETLFEEA